MPFQDRPVNPYDRKQSFPLIPYGSETPHNTWGWQQYARLGMVAAGLMGMRRLAQQPYAGAVPYLDLGVGKAGD